jgi:hypothetical protein
MPGLQVLLTNVTLASRSGTEVNVRDAALGLLRRGHRPVVYSPQLGAIAEEIRAATVPVIDDLDALASAPEVIHGHHHTSTLAALLRFPGTPAVFFVHDWSSWFDEPLRFPRVALYAPVDATNLDRLELEHGVPRERIRLMLNAVDLRRCPPRPPLPSRPRRAVLLSNTAQRSGTLAAVREACARTGLELTVVGAAGGAAVARPEQILATADVVFAKARSALEALAVGAAVILCDEAGLGGMVTRARVEALRPLNFGRRALQLPATPEALVAEIESYDAADAAEASAWIRREADLERALDRLVAVYDEARDIGRARTTDLAEELAATSRYLQRFGPRIADVGAAGELDEAWRQVARGLAALRENELELRDTRAWLAAATRAAYRASRPIRSRLSALYRRLRRLPRAAQSE